MNVKNYYRKTCFVKTAIFKGFASHYRHEREDVLVELFTVVVDHPGVGGHHHLQVVGVTGRAAPAGLPRRLCRRCVARCDHTAHISSHDSYALPGWRVAPPGALINIITIKYLEFRENSRTVHHSACVTLRQLCLMVTRGAAVDGRPYRLTRAQ